MSLLDDCKDDEECLHIIDCDEYKYALARDWDKLRGLKVCGIFAKTVNEEKFAQNDSGKIKTKVVDIFRTSIVARLNPKSTYLLILIQ